MLSLWRVHCLLIFNLLSRTSPVFSYGPVALPVCPQPVHLLQVCPSYLQYFAFVRCCEVLVGPHPACWAPSQSSSGLHCSGCFTQGGVSLLRLHSMSLPKFLMMTDSISPGINCWETLLVNRLLKSVDSCPLSPVVQQVFHSSWNLPTVQVSPVWLQGVISETISKSLLKFR